MLLSFFIFSPDSTHQTLYNRIECLSTMLFFRSIIRWIFRPVWKQPHRLKTPVIEWMESWWSCDMKFESNFRIVHNLPAHTVSSLMPMGLIKNPKTPCTVGELVVTWWFCSECYGIVWHKVDIPSVFWLVNTGVQILMREICIFAVQSVDEFEPVPCIILSITLLKVSATPGIVTTRIGSRAEISAGCLWGGVDLIFNRRWGTEFNLLSAYHSRSSPTMPGKSLCAKITHSLRVFPHKMDSGNPITTFSVTKLQSIAAPP